MPLVAMLLLQVGGISGAISMRHGLLLLLLVLVLLKLLLLLVGPVLLL